MDNLMEQIESTAVLLYQNKEKEGIVEVAKLIRQFQSVLQNMTQMQLENCGRFALLMLKNLIENYENQDMIGMADCLLEKSMLFVQFINQTNEQ